MEAKSTPALRDPDRPVEAGSPASLPWGMATPSPMPVVFSFSRSTSTSNTRPAFSGGYAVASDSDSSRSTSDLFRPVSWGTTACEAEELGDLHSSVPRAPADVRPLR